MDFIVLGFKSFWFLQNKIKLPRYIYFHTDYVEKLLDSNLLFRLMEVQNDPSERRRKKEALWSRLFSELEEFVMTRKEFRPWSSLPTDMMECIMRRLYYSDHVRVRAVCEGWRSMPRVSPLKQLPWLILWGKNECRSFKLIDPQYNRVYTMDMETTVFQGRDLNEIQICASKNSWFLMSSSTDQHVYSFIVYNPFMNSRERIIELPKLNAKQKIHNATFSSNPTSTHCVFLTLSYGDTVVDINTCRRGDRAWTIGTFNNNHPMHEPVNANIEMWVANILWGVESSIGEYSNVAYLDGKFYWPSLYPRMVGTYSIVEKDYHLYEYPPLGLFGSVHFVNTDKDRKILLVQMENRDCSLSRCPGHAIYRLDHRNMTWTKIDRLDDQVLCFGYHNDTAALSVEDRETKNKVYLCRNRSIKYFEINSEQDCCYLNQYNVHNDLEYRQRIYIEPPSQEDGFAGSLGD
ncbi:hypothetical protein AQUCO_00300777v1 [Aquilegia coerulea]|uniref:Uncharacterized protein n=1 Tax=Aquilegia coerulea TaxID=218851 RepID=A0A2G5F0J0_AQUCA|nr:hypothetical protein AQUCO_00300777v1 [Aquilegia coerulea]